MAKRSPTLSPIHRSMRANRRVIGANPARMDSIDVTPEQKHNMDQHALEIFTDCANAGLPFADCLSVVWFSGVAFATHAQSQIAKQEQEQEKEGA